MLNDHRERALPFEAALALWPIMMDWAFAKRALARGDDMEEATRFILSVYRIG